MSVLQFVQSERFSRILVEEIQKRFLQNSGITLEFESTRVSLIPPSTSFQNVKVNYEKDEENVTLITRELTVDFSYINMLASEIVFDRVLIQDAKVVYRNTGETKEKNNEQEKLVNKFDLKDSLEKSSQNLSEVIDIIHENLPIQVNEIDLKRVYFDLRQGSGFVRDLALKIYSNFILMEVELNELYQADESQQLDLNVIDSLSFKVELSRTSLDVKDFIIKNKLNSVAGSARLKFEDSSYELDVKYNGGIDGQLERILDEFNQWADGYCEANLKAKGKADESLSSVLDLKVYEFKSNYFEADQLSLNLSLDENIVKVNSLRVNDNDGDLILKEPVVAFDLKQKEIAENAVLVELQNFHTNSALYAIRKSLHVLKGRMTGDVKVSFDKTRNSVNFGMVKDFNMKNFSLELGEGAPLLTQKSLSFKSGNIQVNTQNALVELDLGIKFGDSTINAEGNIGLGEINIKTKDSYLDFEQLGPISGFPVQGKGPFSLQVKGPLQDVVFDFGLEHQAFSVLGFNLETINANAKLTLKPLQLKVEKLDGNYINSKYSANGLIDFSKKKYDLAVNLKEINYEELKHLLRPVANIIPKLPEDLSFVSRGKFIVKGGFDVDDLNVNGSLKVDNLFYKDEDVEDLSFDLGYASRTLQVKKINLKKSESTAKGNFTINFLTEFFDYDVSWNNMQLSDWEIYNTLNLGLNSKVDIDFYGSGTLKDFTTRTQLSLRDSYIQGYRLEDSLITVFNESSEYYINAAIFGRMIEVDSYVNTLGTKSKDPSKVNVRGNFPDIRVPLGLISATNITDASLKGSILSELKSEFYFDKPEELSLNLKINEFGFSKGDIDFFSEKDNLTLSLEKGRFVVNNLNIKSNRDYFISPILRGDLFNGVNFNTRFKLPAVLASLISQEFAISTGEISGQTQLSGKLTELNHFLEMNAKNITFQTLQLPGIIENLGFDLTLENKAILVKNVVGNYGKGDIKAEGVGVLNFPYPSLNLNVQIDNSYVTFMKRSGGVISGKANLSGSRPPYLVQGHVDILFAEIMEDINDFQSKAASTETYQRYLPRLDGAGVGQPFIFDLTFSILRPLVIRNSMLELSIEGGATLKGTPRTPLIEGAFAALPSSSKFKFKGHEFNLTKGTIDIGRTFSREGAMLDFSGVAQINEYKVRLDVAGRTKNVSVSLSSEPNLSQEDIFSLLTLGVTSEISTELEESERQSVATVGLGALLADQLRLNEGLDSSFGLRLSVAPEYAEETTSLLQGKSAVSDTSTNKFRSSTRIRLQKKVSEKVDLSVSSTVGGSLEQRQEMNINYRINNRWSVEGVYELKSTEDEGVETSDSVGADVKYRWTF